MVDFNSETIVVASCWLLSIDTDKQTNKQTNTHTSKYLDESLFREQQYSI